VVSQSLGYMSKCCFTKRVDFEMWDTDSDSDSDWDTDTNTDYCEICMDNLSDTVLPCTHEFCKKCIDKLGDCICPFCRSAWQEGEDKPNGKVCQTGRIAKRLQWCQTCREIISQPSDHKKHDLTILHTSCLIIKQCVCQSILDVRRKYHNERLEQEEHYFKTKPIFGEINGWQTLDFDKLFAKQESRMEDKVIAKHESMWAKYHANQANHGTYNGVR